MFCAAHAAEMGLRTAVAEHGKSLGRKLGITGKGRCNVTNDCTPDEVRGTFPGIRGSFTARCRNTPRRT